MPMWKLTLEKYGRRTIFSRSYLKKHFSIQDTIPSACPVCKDRIYAISSWRAPNESEESEKWLCIGCGNLLTSPPKGRKPPKPAKPHIKKVVLPKEQAKPRAKAPAPSARPAPAVVETPKEIKPQPVTALSGVGKTMAERLEEVGIKSTADLAKADPEELSERIGKGVSAARIKNWIKQAQEL